MPLQISEIGVQLKVGAPESGEAAGAPEPAPATSPGALSPAALQALVKRCVARVMTSLRQVKAR